MHPTNYDAPNEPQVSATPARRPGPWWPLIGLALTAVGATVYILAYRNAHPVMTPEHWGFVTGGLVGMAVISLLPAAVIVGVTVSRAGRAGNPSAARPWVAWLVFGVLMLVIPSIGALRLISQAQENRALLAETRNAAQALLDGQPLPSGDNPATGQSQVLVDWFRSYTQRGQQVGADMSAALEELGIPTVLTPQTMATPESIADALERVRQMTIRLEWFEQRQTRLLDGAVTEIQALDLPLAMKNDVLKGMNTTLPTTRQRVKTFYQIERDFFAQAKALLTFMQSAQQRNGYRVEGDRIIFASQADVDEFNRLGEKIQQIAQREAEVQAAMRSDLEKTLERMEPYQ